MQTTGAQHSKYNHQIDLFTKFLHEIDDKQMKLTENLSAYQNYCMFYNNYLNYNNKSKISMIAQNLKIKEQQNIALGSSIVTIHSCNQFFGLGCLDDSVRIWRNKFSPFERKPMIQYNQSISGISDIAFMSNSTHAAALSLDSTLKIWDLDTNLMTTVDTPTLSIFKICFVGDTLVTCGDLGKIFYYDIFSKQIIRKINLDDTSYITAITTRESQKKISIANMNGQIYMFGFEGKQDIVNAKPHSKSIRSISFSKNFEKLFTGSDDSIIAMTDLNTLKVQQTFQGHQQKVSCVKNHPIHQNMLYSCSFDKTIKLWDTRVKNHVYNYTSSGPLWSIQPLGKNLIAGGEQGILQILIVQ